MLEYLTTVAGELPYILQGIFVTLGIVLSAMCMGMIMGIPMSIAQVYGNRRVRALAGFYVWFFRGCPILVLLYLFYFGLFPALGINFPAIVSCSVVLGLTSTAYQSQIFRGCIESLPAGQLKAARALGMSEIQSLKSIILPQAMRLALPGWSNEYSILLKDSALVYVLGVPEIMARSHFVASRTSWHVTYYILAGILYFVVTTVGLKLLRKLEQKVRLPGYNV